MAVSMKKLRLYLFVMQVSSTWHTDVALERRSARLTS